MGFRNPITSAAAVDTRPGATVAGVRMYEAADAFGRWGMVEFTDPDADAPSYLQGRANHTVGGSLQGGSVSLQGGSYNGAAGPRLDLQVAQAATTGYDASARLSGLKRFYVDAPVELAAGNAATLPKNPGAVLVPAGGSLPDDFQPQFRAGTLIATASNVGIVVVPFSTPFPNGLISALAFPGDTANLPAELLAFAYSLSSFSLSVRTNTGAQLVNAQVRINYLAVGW